MKDFKFFKGSVNMFYGTNVDDIVITLLKYAHITRTKILGITMKNMLGGNEEIMIDDITYIGLDKIRIKYRIFDGEGIVYIYKLIMDYDDYFIKTY